MDAAGTVATAATLVGVLLGGWLTVRKQDRISRRAAARQLRNIRLAPYKDFLSAYRGYLAFVQDPDSKITAMPHPSRANELMQYFGADGRPYREKLEGARVVSQSGCRKGPRVPAALSYSAQNVAYIQWRSRSRTLRATGSPTICYQGSRKSNGQFDANVCHWKRAICGIGVSPATASVRPPQGRKPRVAR